MASATAWVSARSCVPKQFDGHACAAFGIDRQAKEGDNVKEQPDGPARKLRGDSLGCGKTQVVGRVCLQRYNDTLDHEFGCDDGAGRRTELACPVNRDGGRRSINMKDPDLDGLVLGRVALRLAAPG